MKTGICSHCLEPCEVVFDDTGKLSNCCYAPIVDPAVSEIDEVETPGGHLPYGGGE